MLIIIPLGYIKGTRNDEVTSSICVSVIGFRIEIGTDRNSGPGASCAMFCSDLGSVSRKCHTKQPLSRPYVSVIIFLTFSTFDFTTQIYFIILLVEKRLVQWSPVLSPFCCVSLLQPLR